MERTLSCRAAYEEEVEEERLAEKDAQLAADADKLEGGGGEASTSDANK